MTTRLRAILSDLRARLEKLYGERLVKLVLYGSQARGDSEPGSDIDVLVVLRGEVRPCEEIERTLEDVTTVSLEYAATVACVFVSDARYRKEQSPLLMNVRREGVPA